MIHKHNVKLIHPIWKEVDWLMITREIFADILAIYKQGKSIRQIAKETGYSRNTVRKYIVDKNYPIYKKSKARKCVLDDFKEYIENRIKQAMPKWIEATAIFSEIKNKGYKGGISILWSYMNQFKTKEVEDKEIRFETVLAEQLQIAFTTIKHGKTRYKAFVATLEYSRYCYVEFFNDEKASSWIKGLEHSFRYFNGVPKEILFDNAKALVTQRDAYGIGAHKFNDLLLDLSKKHGFKLKACKPYRAKTKGKVERFDAI